MNRPAMLRAATEYLRAGWPIGAVRNPDCPPPESSDVRPTPRAAGGKQLTSEHQLRAHWGKDTPTQFTIVLLCGRGYDVWAVPAAIGVRALDALPDDIQCWLSGAAAPCGTWYFITDTVPAEATVTIDPDLPVRHLGLGAYVPLPPTTPSPSGPNLWLSPSNDPRRPAPWQPVAYALAEAANPQIACA